MVHRIFGMERDDARALQRLGAAVVLIWSEIPRPLQEEIIARFRGLDGMGDPEEEARRIRNLVMRG